MTESNVDDKSNNRIFDFIKDPEKLKILINANEMLNIHKDNRNKIIFVYSAPKVGSTSIVSSLRIFGVDKFVIIHIHDEEMLRVLGHIEGITINEIILFNKYLGKEVYVIDVFRSPIERKISVFFEKIGSYHFNNTDDAVNKYNVNKVIKRFNNIFSYIGVGDHFIDRYGINIPEQFDFNSRYLLLEQNGIKYIKLRLKDSSIWGPILSSIFGTKICIVKDYESTNKPIKNIYTLFKSTYRIPKNFLDEIMNCKYLQYYYSEEERNAYFSEWVNKSEDNYIGYTPEQYAMYQDITMENSYIDYIQLDHYMDEGCICKACGLKRADIAAKIMRGVEVTDRIIHVNAKSEFIHKREAQVQVQVNKINKVLQNIPVKPKQKNLRNQLSNLVKNKNAK